MNFIVLEIQTDANGTTSVLKDIFTSQAQAESKYYTILSFAAISEIPVHAAVMLDQNGQAYMAHCYDRTEVEE